MNFAVRKDKSESVAKQATPAPAAQAERKFGTGTRVIGGATTIAVALGGLVLVSDLNDAEAKPKGKAAATAKAKRKAKAAENAEMKFDIVVPAAATEPKAKPKVDKKSVDAVDEALGETGDELLPAKKPASQPAPKPAEKKIIEVKAEVKSEAKTEASTTEDSPFYPGRLLSADGGNTANVAILDVRISDRLREIGTKQETGLTIAGLDALFRVARSGRGKVAFLLGVGGAGTVQKPELVISPDRTERSDVSGGIVKGNAGLAIDTSRVKVLLKGGLGARINSQTKTVESKGRESEVNLNYDKAFLYGDGSAEAYISTGPLAISLGGGYSSLPCIGAEAFLGLASRTWGSRRFFPGPFELLVEYRTNELLSGAGKGTERRHVLDGTVMVPVVQVWKRKHVTAGLVYTFEKEWLAQNGSALANGIGASLSLGRKALLVGGYAVEPKTGFVRLVFSSEGWLHLDGRVSGITSDGRPDTTANTRLTIPRY